MAILLAPLGGLWWPLELVGPFMRRVAYFTPTGWAMEGVNAMLAFGAGAADVAPFALGFAALFAVSFPAGGPAAEGLTGRTALTQPQGPRPSSNSVQPVPRPVRISNRAPSPGCKLGPSPLQP